MSKGPRSNTDPVFVSQSGGLTNRIAGRIRLLEPPVWRRILRAFLLILLTWLPLVILAAFAGHAIGTNVVVSLWRDPEVNARFLLALPLLEAAEVFGIFWLALQIRQFLGTDIIPPRDRPQFDAAIAQSQRWQDSTISEVVMFVIAIAASFISRHYMLSGGHSTWERLATGMTPAGWWHMLISLPILYFFLLRALWIFVLWSWFLLRVSRIELNLTPTHPDQAGGLGFVAYGQASFAPMVLALSVVVSAGCAYEIYHRGGSLNSLKYHVIVYVVLILCLVHLPLLAFAAQLSRRRFEGLLRFGNLIWRHDSAFDEKWLSNDSKNREPLLGTMDIQSLAHIATAYHHIQEMRMIPIDRAALAVLFVSAAIPFLPLIGTEIPFPEIIAKLGELLI
ncbi:MAG: hypothetical protein JSS49_07290 [Planctomycetes bacterium]|nr:hypothetical protein [Planctomycetota bacterium]